MELSCTEVLGADLVTEADSLLTWSSPLTCSPSPEPTRAPRRRARYVQNDVAAAGIGGESSHLELLVNRERQFIVPESFREQEGVFAQIREEIVGWFMDLAAELQLPQATVAVAVNILDRFVAAHKVPSSVLNGLATTCFILACKVTEDVDVPAQDVLQRTGVSLSDMCKLESVVLARLDWRLNVVTVQEVFEAVFAGVGETPSAEQYLLLDALASGVLFESSLACCAPTAVGIACIAHMLELSWSRSTGGAQRTISWKHGSMLLARECGVDMAQVENILPVIRKSMQKIFESATASED